MLNRILQKSLIKVTLAFVVLLCITGISSAAEYSLRADVTTKTMPDGRVITMWGFALDQYDIGGGPVAGDGIVKVPGPALVVPPGQGLTINLTNNLPESVSIVIPGQITTMAPVWDDGSTGPRPSLTARVRSFTQEAQAKVGTTPGTATYTWTNLKLGTYLYHSGAHPSVQVQMGLYGAVKIDAATGQAYTPTATNPDTTYNSEVILLFSEIDPALHDAVANCNYGAGKTITSTINYEPKYFLINGEPFSPGSSPIPAGNPTDRILIRFLNAGYKDYVPTVQGPYMTVLAEDGNLYPYPKQEYSVLLPAAKTKDAILVPGSAGYFPVYDRRLDLINDLSSPGGMLAYLTIAAATQNTLTVTDPGYAGKIEATSLPGGINCGRGGIDCTEPYNTGTVVALTVTPAKGATFVNWTNVDTGTETSTTAKVTMNADKTVTANFTFASVTLLTPNGGEVIPSGSTYTIWWGAPATAVKFNLMLSLDNGVTWAPIKNNVTGTSFSWTVPTPLGNKKKCFIKVIGYTASGVKVGADKSDAPFTIEVVKLTSPNGGETITSGLTYCIHWTRNVTAKPVAKVKLEYTKDGGTTWLPIAALKDPYISEGLHSYDLWTVPTVGKTKNTKVRVTLLDSLGNILGRDASDGTFTIQPAPTP
jgi:FtsP/CotA-like multicopper oxidase with cupredoxin domain